MKALSIDLETYSSVDLGKSSVYRYVESPDFDILLLGFSADGSQVQVVDLAQGEQIPPEIIDALSDERVHKWAFNANFNASASLSGCAETAIRFTTNTTLPLTIPAWATLIRLAGIAPWSGQPILVCRCP